MVDKVSQEPDCSYCTCLWEVGRVAFVPWVRQGETAGNRLLGSRAPGSQTYLGRKRSQQVEGMSGNQNTKGCFYEGGTGNYSSKK